MSYFIFDALKGFFFCMSLHPRKKSFSQLRSDEGTVHFHTTYLILINDHTAEWHISPCKQTAVKSIVSRGTDRS